MPTQLRLPIEPRTRPDRGHGGARPGAGRPKTSRLQAHAKRGIFQARHPLHVTIKLRSGLPDLRKKQAHACFRRSVLQARKHGLAVAHFAVLSNHVHLILESQGPMTLGKQMQSLGISLAKRINALSDKTGPVFEERYHVHILKTPTEVKHALAYVLSNAYRHAGSRGRIALDGLSSALTVADAMWEGLLGRTWKRVVGFPEWQLDPSEMDHASTAVGVLLTRPGTWLLTQGWMRA